MLHRTINTYTIKTLVTYTQETDMFLTSLFTAVRDWVRAHNSYQNTVWELSSLTDRDLKDLGISRSDIHRVAAESTQKRFKKEPSEDRFQRTLVAKEA